MTTRICPDCQTALKAFDRDGITVDFCEKCHGVFFDKGELVRLGEKFKKTLLNAKSEPSPKVKSPALPEPAARSGERRCPECQVAMSATVISKIEVDRCGRCYGMWLDNGELGQYLQHVAKSIKRPTGSPAGNVAKGLRLNPDGKGYSPWLHSPRYDDLWDRAWTFGWVMEIISDTTSFD